MRKLILTTVLMAAFCSVSFGQTLITLDAASHNKKFETCDAIFYDNKPAGNYAPNADWWTTLCPQGSNKRIKLEFESFAIDPSDTVFIYYGTTINDPTATTSSGVPYFQNNDLNKKTIMPPVVDTSGCVTIRLKSDATKVAQGWEATVSCEKTCQDLYVDLEEEFTRIDAAGNETTRKVRDEVERKVTEVFYTKNQTPIYDSISEDENGKHHFFLFDTIRFKAIDLCMGDSVILKAKPLFPYNDAAYHQTPEACIYYWNFGDNLEFDTIEYTPVAAHRWAALSGYDLELTILDTNNGGCITTENLGARVRISQDPIKMHQTLPDICSGENLPVSVGISGSSTIIIDTLNFNQSSREIVETRTFIPDGGSTPSGNACYESNIMFTSFTSGATVVKGEEIEDLCIEMEHSNVQDLAMYLICPTGKTVTLKYPTNNPFQTFLGQPAGTITSGYLTYDTEDNQPINDSNANKMGYTWTYCFSNTYLTNPQGVLHGVVPNVIKNFTYGESETGSTWFTNDVVDSTHYWVDKIMFFQTPTQGILGSTTYDATNPSAAYFDALTPDLTGFDQFIGCPLNGTWTLRICDNLEDNNGWITSWWMDVSKTAATEWTYEVPIDTVLWGGPFIDAKTSTAQTAVISPKIAECGEYSYNVQVVDYFGCKWPVKNDLKLDLNVVCTPVVSLGDDIHVCEGTSVPLDAGNKGATAFAWEPTGDKTQKITVKSAENVIGRKSYAVQVTNFNGNLYCYGGDTIDIITHPAATASFTSDVMPLEGCEPYTFRLISTSSEAAKYEWSLGDGLYNTTEASPTFTFPYGTYDLKLKVTSDFGCVDSVYYDNMINVFKSPAANFGWEPTVPYASSPTVNMINLTVPEDENNRYRWWIQTNKHNENDIVNEYGKTPTFTWVAQEGENVAGDYNITLDAYSYNVAPSGNIYECHDTITKTITIINDNIIFPTVVTPNADGINDVFDIHNLIEGQAFPDNELAVYNRLGKRIYFVQDIRNKDQFWDPDKTNSPTGTYFYRFIGRGPVRNVEFKGSVEVIRD